MCGKKNRGRIRHFAQALVGHREHAEFIDRTEAVLERAQHAETAAGFALEIQHRIDHVFEHARAGDAAFLGHVADQEHAGAAFLREAHEACCRFAHLADRTRRGSQGFGPDRLDGINNEHAWCIFLRNFHNALNAGFGQTAQRIQRQAQALRTRGDLRDGFLAADVQTFQARAERAQHLQQQGRLADAGIAADQHDRTGDQTAAEHAIELADADGRACLGTRRHVGELHDLRLRHGTCITTALGRARTRRRYDKLAQRIPRLAGLALALPLCILGAALIADVGGLGFGHQNLSKRSAPHHTKNTSN